jgi:hypothetical protein
MFRMICVVTIGILHSLLILNPVHAHKLDTDSGAGAVIHLDPDDSPISGRPTAISWEFAEENNVKVTQCDCEIEIYRASDLKRSVNSGITEVLADNIAGYTYTFPEAGEYKLILKGEATNGGEFDEFKLEYYTTVSSPSVNTSGGFASWGVLLVCVLIGSLLVAGGLIVAKKTKE